MPTLANLTDKQIMQALERTYGVIGNAARALGVSTRTLQRRLAANPKLIETAYDVRETIYDIALWNIIQSIESGDWRSAKWYLDRFATDRGYGTRRTIARAMAQEKADRLVAERTAFLAELKKDPAYRVFLAAFTTESGV